jgi:hypothetical protein
MGHIDRLFIHYATLIHLQKLYISELNGKMMAGYSLNHFLYISWPVILSVSGADPLQNIIIGVTENATLYKDDRQQCRPLKSQVLTCTQCPINFSFL